MEPIPPKEEMDRRERIQRRRGQTILTELISEEQWATYATVLLAAQASGVRFALGGGLASSAYSGFVRNTKDMDLYVLPEDHRLLLRLMDKERFEDYNRYPYDRRWSYRGCRDGFIIDVLWKMLNERGEIDELWVTRGWELEVRGVKVRLLPVEELIWSKLYILHRDRCDWPDILNLLFAQGIALDWGHLFHRLGEDAHVMGGIMNLFRWMCPGRAAELPEWIWPFLGLTTLSEEQATLVDRRRAALFNGNDWFPAASM